MKTIHKNINLAGPFRFPGRDKTTVLTKFWGGMNDFNRFLFSPIRRTKIVVSILSSNRVGTVASELNVQIWVTIVVWSHGDDQIFVLVCNCEGIVPPLGFVHVTALWYTALQRYWGVIVQIRHYGVRGHFVVTFYTNEVLTHRRVRRYFARFFVILVYGNNVGPYGPVRPHVIRAVGVRSLFPQRNEYVGIPTERRYRDAQVLVRIEHLESIIAQLIFLDKIAGIFLAIRRFEPTWTLAGHGPWPAVAA